MLQKQLALSTNLDPSYLAGVESGRRPVPRLEVLQSIFAVLELQTDEINMLLEAAVWEKIASYLEKMERTLPKVQALTRLSKLLPVLTEKQAATCIGLIETLIENKAEEPTKS